MKKLVGVFALVSLVGATHMAMASEPSDAYMSECKKRIQYNDETTQITHDILDDLVEKGIPRADVEAMEDEARDMLTTELCKMEYEEANAAPVDKYNGNFLSCTFGEGGSDKVLKMTEDRLNDMVRRGVIRDSQKGDMRDDVHTNALREVCMGMGYKP